MTPGSICLPHRRPSSGAECFTRPLSLFSFWWKIEGKNCLIIAIGEAPTSREGETANLLSSGPVDGLKSAIDNRDKYRNYTVAPYDIDSVHKVDDKAEPYYGLIRVLDSPLALSGSLSFKSMYIYFLVLWLNPRGD